VTTGHTTLKIISLLTLALVGTAETVPLDAATITASSCSRDDVEAAIRAARDGDTVTIPAGTCTWTAGVAITTPIVLMGAGPDATIIIDHVPGITILVNTQAGQFYRLSGFTLRRGTVTKNSNVRAVLYALGSSHTVRLDHLRFERPSVRAIHVGGERGDVRGVIDHNEFLMSGGIAIEVEHHAWNGVGNFGDNSWAEPSHFGTDQFVFIEDNSFRGPEGAHFWALDGQRGGRAVFRYNIVENGSLSVHGTESGGRSRGFRALELYRNKFHLSLPRGAGQIRAGTGVFFDNDITGRATNIWPLDNNRSLQNWFWPVCDGSSPFDINDGVVYASGVHDGPEDSESLVDSTKRWTPNTWRDGGYSVRNVTKGEGSFVTANTATTITIGRRSGTVLFDPGDAYQILRATICMDAPGSGHGALLSGQDPRPKAPVNQVRDPLYQWNNTINGKAGAWASDHFNPHIVAGRDYVNGVKPNYTPYAYPHPLTSITRPPSAPTRLRIVP